MKSSTDQRVREQAAPDAAQRQARVGFFYALSAYLWWGFIPLYFKLLETIAPLTVLAHRVIWSVIFLLAIVASQRRWGEVRAALAVWSTVGRLAIAAVLVAINWYTFIWAVSHHHTLQASLGYFINPLVTVLLAMVFLKERLHPWQWVSVALATAAVLNLAILGDTFPWVALILALSFGLYGLVRKVVIVGPLIGLLVETIVLAPVALVVLWMVPGTPWSELSVGLKGLLSISGVITALPLIWFAAGARRLRLSTMGFLQYAGPTVQFLVALLVFKEPLESQKLISFAIIWVALVIYTADTVRRHRERQMVVETPE